MSTFNPRASHAQFDKQLTNFGMDIIAHFETALYISDYKHVKLRRL